METTAREFRDFVNAYIACALWITHDGSNDSGGEPLDRNYSSEYLTEDARANIESECWGFVALNADDIDTMPRAPDGDSNYGYAGHLFWLNRNGHGTGFWDRGDTIDPEVCERLHKSSKSAGERDLYVGDDGRLHYS